MTSQNNLYVTQSRVAVKPIRAAFLKILGVDFIFKTLTCAAIRNSKMPLHAANTGHNRTRAQACREVALMAN